MDVTNLTTLTFTPAITHTTTTTTTTSVETATKEAKS